MTVALSFVTVADSIADLEISGVTIKSLANIPQGGQMILPILFPQPNGFITDISPESQSFGTGATAAINFSYTLHYVYLLSEAGGGLSQFDSYETLARNLETIWETIITNDIVTGLVDIRLNSVEGMGRIEGTDGNQYWGALFSLRCLEFAQ